ncbi:MAG TPA: sigma-70 family RNA polymerase sigma factor [Chloroflexota bacterium]|nr:sigma-70 family RNA polymerase sigma factor [Chloroflexota bacterium]
MFCCTAQPCNRSSIRRVVRCEEQIQWEGIVSDLEQRLAQNLDGSFEDLVLTYERRLYAFAYRATGCRQEAEDLTQDTFVRAYHALASYDGRRIRALHLQAWLYRIIVNLSRNRVRRKRPAMEALNGNEPDGAEVTPHGVHERAERAEEMAALLGLLPHHLRVPIVLKYVNELSYPEISELLEQPVGTVKSNVHRGLQSLRKSLDSTRPDKEIPVREH